MMERFGEAEINAGGGGPSEVVIQRDAFVFNCKLFVQSE